MHFLGHVAALAWKDLRVEVRSGEILWNMTFFASMVVVVFSFAFLRGGELEAAMGPGVIWIAMAFAGSLGLARAFDREREGDTMRGLLLSPAPRAAIFLGKALAISVYILVVATVVTLLTWFLFDAPLLSHPLILALLLLLGAFGIAVVGSTFAGVLLRTRARDVLLPVVLYPLLVPLFLAGSKATGALMEDSVAGAWQWIRILVAYDALFLVVSLWSFESLVIE